MQRIRERATCTRRTPVRPTGTTPPTIPPYTPTGRARAGHHAATLIGGTR
ncbi:hypothetical protein [Streptomyces sp. NBRC 109706]|nr:hypothetical protein [Streptomyces sp. NBRC 109706]